VSSLLTILPFPYRILALALLAASLFGYGFLKGAQHGEAKLAAFTEQVKSEGIKAQAMADARVVADRQRKEASDASYTKALVLLSADANRMRNDAGSSSVPARPADTRCPETWACFDRAELDTALRRFTTDTAGIASEGAAITLRLETAIRWANQ
jgi:hypothetical protein